MTHKLFTPLTLGPLTLQHRVVMAPLTRMRASPDGNVPTALNALYYAQRATPGGLQIAEATPVSWQGHGHPNVPGIHTAAQVAGWRRVTDAVHERRRLHRACSCGTPGASRIPATRRAARRRSVRRPSPRRARPSTPPGRACPTRCRARWNWPRCRRWSTVGARLRPTRCAPASTASKSTAPTATCSSSSCSRAATSAPTATAAASRTAAACTWRLPRPWRRKSAPSAPASACRPGALPTTAARPSRCRCTRTWCASWRSWSWPTCT